LQFFAWLPPLIFTLTTSHVSRHATQPFLDSV
jgi:hypothetical protein